MATYPESMLLAEGLTMESEGKNESPGLLHGFCLGTWENGTALDEGQGRLWK